MKRALSFLVVAVALVLGACDNNTEPMKARTAMVTNPQVDQGPKLATGGDQTATVPQNK